MSPNIDILVGRQREADLRRATERRDAISTRLVAAPALAVELRLAGPDDAPVLRRLADLDDASPLMGPALIARIDGEPVAALSLADQRVVANPFRRTGDTIALLRLRAAHLSNAPRRRARLGFHVSRRRGDAIVPCGE